MTSYWHSLLFLWEPEAFKQAMRVKSCVRWLMSWSTCEVWWVYGQALFSNLQATSGFLQAVSITKALWSGILTAVKSVFLCPLVLLLSATHLMFGFHLRWHLCNICWELATCKVLYKVVNYKAVCYSTMCGCVCGRTCAFMKGFWLHIVLDLSHSIIQHTSSCPTIWRPGLLFSFIVFRPKTDGYNSPGWIIFLPAC